MNESITLTEKKIQEILKSNLTIDGFVYLYLTKINKLKEYNYFFGGLMQSLINNGFLNKDNQLTQKSINLLKSIEKSTDVPKLNIYENLQKELLTLTGKKQVVDKIQSVSYSFLPNEVDFYTKFNKTCAKYKIDNFEKAEKVLLNYIRKCNKSKNWFPVMKYYLLKEDQSSFATDYFNFEDVEENYYDGVNI